MTNSYEVNEDEIGNFETSILGKRRKGVLWGGRQDIRYLMIGLFMLPEIHLVSTLITAQLTRVPELRKKWVETRGQNVSVGWDNKYWVSPSDRRTNTWKS